MPLDITFTLSDQDLDHFQAIVNKAKSKCSSIKGSVFRDYETERTN